MVRFLAATDWGKVLTALISAVSAALATVLAYRRFVVRERPITQIRVEDASVVRQRQLAEAWAEMVAHTEDRMRQAEYSLDQCRTALRDCEQSATALEAELTRKLLVEQGHVDTLRREVTRLRELTRKAGS